MHVDWENRKAIRGSYLGRRKADGRHMLLCLDIGECKIVTKDSLYATTELAAKTELKVNMIIIALVVQIFSYMCNPQVKAAEYIAIQLGIRGHAG